MRVALLEPPPVGILGNLRSKGSFGTFKADIRWPPIDLIILAGFIRQQGHDCFIIDAGGEHLNVDEIKGRLKQEKYELLLFNTSTTTIFFDMEMAVLSKSLRPETLIGALGVHPMGEPEETLLIEPAVDFCIISEIEPPLLEIMNGASIRDVEGVAYRDSESIVRNPSPKPLRKLDDMGVPAHDLIPVHIYKDPQVKRVPYSVTMLTRGCVCACTFCSAPLYSYYRKRSIENVILELKWVTEELGIRELKFYDDGLAYDRKWLVKLCEAMIKEQIDLTWNTNERAEFIDEELAHLMKKAGCYSINVGVESGSSQVLKNVDKKTTHEKIIRGAQSIKAAGIQLMTYFVIGFPGETLETIEETYELAVQLDGDFATFNIATPHPGTPFMSYLENNNYLRHRDYTKYDQNGLPSFEYPDLSAQQIFDAANRLTRRFYLRPKMIRRKFLETKSLFQLLNLFMNFVAFMKYFVLRFERLRPVSDQEITTRVQKRQQAAISMRRKEEMGSSKELFTWKEYKANKKLENESVGKKTYNFETPAESVIITD